MNKDLKRRHAALVATWMEEGQSYSEAVETAWDQIDWEDGEEFEPCWQGPNDSLPFHSY